VKPVFANQGTILQAAELLRQGKLVAIPTETVYGLGTNARNPVAVKRVFDAKGRPADHPLIVHIADVNQLIDWAVNIPDKVYRLAEKFWPGPLTLVLQKHPSVPYEVTGGQETIALRIPNHPVALAVLKAFGGGIAAPSANRYCRISPTQASHVEEELGDKVDMILDGGICEVGLESTIIDLTSETPRLLRPGQINQSEIAALLQTTVKIPDNDEVIRVSGRKEVHYAPQTQTLLCTKEQFEVVLGGDAFQGKHKIGLLTYARSVRSEWFDQIMVMPSDVNAYGHDLYGRLRELDHAGLDLILIEQPPQTEEWRAVNDRLEKATKAYY
jgi:L-threonylcarbamoyladenylate synthase